MEWKRSNTPTEKEEKDLFDADQLEQYINSQIEARLGKAQQSAAATRRLENKLFEHGVPISKFQEWLSAHGGTEINSFSVNAFLSQYQQPKNTLTQKKKPKAYETPTTLLRFKGNAGTGKAKSTAEDLFFKDVGKSISNQFGGGIKEIKR